MGTLKRMETMTDKATSGSGNFSPGMSFVAIVGVVKWKVNEKLQSGFNGVEIQLFVLVLSMDSNPERKTLKLLLLPPIHH